jgi:hypothetical protein
MYVYLNRRNIFVFIGNIYLFIYLCMYVCIYIRMYIHACIHIYM